MSKGLFITGTGTDTGKTYITALLLKKLNESGYNCAYYKAAMSGNERDSKGALIPGDALHVKNVSGIGQPLAEMCPYIYETAVSPHLASKIEGNPVEMDIVKEKYMKLTEKYDIVTMEGSGGIFCPIRFDDEAEIELGDIIRELDLPCLLVADAGLGTINNVVLSTAYARDNGIKISGIIFNNFHKGSLMEEDNVKMCEYYTGLKVIAKVSQGDTDIDISADELLSFYR